MSWPEDISLRDRKATAPFRKQRSGGGLVTAVGPPMLWIPGTPDLGA